MTAPRSEGCSPCPPPPKLGAAGRGRRGKGLRWKSFAGGRSQRRMFLILGVSVGHHRVSDRPPQMPCSWKRAGFPTVQWHDSCFARAASAYKGPFKVSGSQTWPGDHPPIPFRLSIPYYFAGQSQNLQEKEQDREQKKSQWLLGSLQAKNEVVYCRRLLAER